MKIKKYFKTFSISIRNALFYSKNLFGGIIMYTLFIYVFFRLWGVIYQTDTIAGYTYNQMIWYVCMTEIIVLSIGTFVLYDISEEIKSGAIAYQLGRPYNYIIYVFSNTMGASFIKLLLYAVIGGILGTILVGPPPISNFVMIPWFLGSLILSLMLRFFMLMTIALTAFFVEENRPFFFIYSKLVLMLGTFVPIEFFPVWMQSILKYLPFSYITWAPAKIFVDFSLDHAVNTIIMQIIWAVLSITLCMGVYQKGVKSVHVHGG